MKREEGHVLLKRLGKTKLRPGGVRGTNWLFDQAEVQSGTKILEVACNEGDNLIYLSKKYGNENFGIDKNRQWLESGIEKVRRENLEDKVKLAVGDAVKLPFPDESFDIVLNEAMLTMLDEPHKKLALQEYLRVLKPGGCLLTHDVRQVTEDREEVRQLQKVLNIPALPLTLESWIGLFESIGFRDITYDTAPMTLFSEQGLETDEGRERVQEIFAKAMQDENRDQFIEMMDFFRSPSVKDNLYYIVMKAVK